MSEPRAEILQAKEDKRERLSLRELFFLSFGGQAPLISLLTFGTAMVILAGEAAPLAMLIATAVVSINGLVVYFMSRRFKRGGGYYVYAYYSLTPNLGLNAGWTYVAYAIAYGGTLLAGGAYVLQQGVGNVVPQWAFALLVSSAAATVVMLGIRYSAKYAEAVSIAEMIIIVTLSVVFLRDSGWRLYDPFRFGLSSTLLAATLLGLGIPTGYGSIAPLGSDAESRSIGKAAIMVVLYGGLLASLFLYSLEAMKFSGNLVEYSLHRFGLYSLVPLAIIAINDGALGGVSYMLALSRTIEAMALDGYMPRSLSARARGRPLYAEAMAAALFVAVLTLLAYRLGLFYTFVALGSLAGMFNLFIHSSANFSLARLSARRALKHLHELIIGLLGASLSIFVLLYSLPSVNKYVVYVFMGWIILGFFYAEILDMLGSERPGRRSISRNPVRGHLGRARG